MRSLAGALARAVAIAASINRRASIDRRRCVVGFPTDLHTCFGAQPFAIFHDNEAVAALNQSLAFKCR